MKEIPKNDCIIVLGDLNEQLGHQPKLSGKWSHGNASQNDHKVLDMMRMFDLQAANTYYQSRRGKSNATYMACVEGTEEGKLQGREVINKYKGIKYRGTIG